MRKRFIALLLAFCLILGCTAAAAADDTVADAAADEAVADAAAADETVTDETVTDETVAAYEAAGMDEAEEDAGQISRGRAAESIEVLSASGDGMTEFNDADETDWSGYSIYNASNGKSVKGSKAFVIPEEGVTLLMFFSITCGNCMADMQLIAETDWIKNDKVRVMALETNGADQEETVSFLKDYAGTAKKYFKAYYGSGCTDLMWDYVFNLFNSWSVTWPLLVLLTEEDGVPTVRYASTGYQYISEITEHVEALLEEAKKPDAPELQSLSSSSRGVALSWNSTGAEKYRLFRKASGGSWETLKTTAKTGYTDTKAQMGTKYAYRVCAYKNSKWSDYSSSKSILFNPFTDISSGAKAFEYISWAYNNGIVTGTSDTTFSPDNTCTKAQFVMMLWKMNGSPAVSGTNPFSDIEDGTKICKAVLWALDKGIVNSGSTFNPGAPITRGQIVMILWKLAGSPKASGENPFTDIEDGTKLCKAAMWAYQNGITKGASETTFAPDKNCTRQQLVTFLYKYNSVYKLV